MFSSLSIPIKWFICCFLIFPWLSIGSELILIGNPLSLCTNLQPQHCVSNGLSQNENPALVYQFSDNAIDLLLNSYAIKTLSPPIQIQLAKVLEKAASDYSGKNTTDADMNRFFMQLLSLLPPLQQRAAKAYLQVHNQPSEQVILSLNKNLYTDVFLKKYINTLTSHTSDDTPTVGIITAGASMPYKMAEQYRQLFHQLGVNGIWFPVNEVINKGMMDNKCNHLDEFRQSSGHFNIPLLYPSLVKQEHQRCLKPKGLTSLLESLDGLYFVNGNPLALAQILTSSSSKLSLVGDEIQRLFHQNKLIVAAEGDSVLGITGNNSVAKPIPMMINGKGLDGFNNALKPTNVLSSHTNNTFSYHPQGGLPLFNIGPIDIAFSEKDRLPRLAILAAKLGQTYGIGIDENTALYVSGDQNKTVTVLGSGGATLLDFTNGTLQSTATTTQLITSVSYLLHGDKINWRSQTGKVEITRHNVATGKLNQSNQLGFLRYRHNLHCYKKTPLRYPHAGLNYLWFPDENTQYFISNQNNHCGFINLTLGLKN
jgi:cyanophycinase-like exopeptidase